MYVHSFPYRQDALTFGVSSVSAITAKPWPSGQQVIHVYLSMCLLSTGNYSPESQRDVHDAMSNSQTYTVIGHARTGNVDRIRTSYSIARLYSALPRAETYSGEPSESGPVRV